VRTILSLEFRQRALGAGLLGGECGI